MQPPDAVRIRLDARVVRYNNLNITPGKRKKLRDDPAYHWRDQMCGNFARLVLTRTVYLLRNIPLAQPGRLFSVTCDLSRKRTKCKKTIPKLSVNNEASHYGVLCDQVKVMRQPNGRTKRDSFSARSLCGCTCLVLLHNT